MGCSALLVPSACPAGHSPSHVGLFPVWEVAQEAGLPIVFHVGGGGRLLVAALLRQRPAAGRRLPWRRGELPLGRLHGHPLPAHADPRHDDLRWRPRSLPAAQGRRHRAGRRLAAELDAPARHGVRGVRARRGTAPQARASAERLRAPPDPRHALLDRARRLDHRAVGRRGLPVLVRLAARRGRSQPDQALCRQPGRDAGGSAAAASTATTSST